MNENITTEITTQELLGLSASPEEEARTEYNLDRPASLGQAAGIMGKGMFGIFVVIGVIILCVYALNKAGSRSKKEKKDSE